MERNSVRSRGFWEDVWSDDRNYEFWTQVSPEVADLIRCQSPQERPEVLDLGCGLGRNAVAFAQAGFQVTATDLAPKGVAHLEAWSEKLNLPIRTMICSFCEDVFPPESFDIVVSVNVIYHAYREEFVQAIGNVRRWLKYGGIFYFTCPTRQEDGKYGHSEELAPHTFQLEPGHVHYHTDEADLDELLTGFRTLSRRKRERHWEKDGVPQFSSRWRVLVEKLC
jgi:SAM-dependent methyltransferase